LPFVGSINTRNSAETIEVAVLLNSSARVLAYAATGGYGSNQLRFMREAGTNIVGMVSLGHGGEQIQDMPIYDDVASAVAETQANTAVIYAPPGGVRSAIVECADGGIKLAVPVAEFVPVHDTMWACKYARERELWVVGPNTVGMATPGVAMLGSITSTFTRPGRVGVISRSGTMTMMIARELSSRGIGQSTLVHVGGDSIAGRNPHEWLRQFIKDDETDTVLYIGEIGGQKEYAMADVIAAGTKPVVALIVGRNAPAEKQMGHAGALIGSARETAHSKRDALREAGAIVCDSPMELAHVLSGLASDIGAREKAGEQHQRARSFEMARRDERCA
jgi:succinyl-CoA synthetase alpha subunit